MKKINPAQMKLGDTVKLFEGSFGYGIVIQIENDVVRIFRPYATCSDFSMIGNQVIPYTGHEICTYLTSDNFEFELCFRRDIK